MTDLAVNLSEVGVGLDERLPFVRHIIFFEDSVDRALWLAGTAIDALIWVDVEHVHALAVHRMDAVDGADFYTSLVLYVDAGLCDDVRHSLFLPSC